MINLSSWHWSHSFKNYILMYDLNTSEFSQPVLDVAAGSSSFNYEMKHQGYHVVSCDPLYATAPEDIDVAVKTMLQNLHTLVQAHVERYHWGEEFAHPSELARQQDAVAEIFIRDYARGVHEKRYVAETLPRFHFEDFQFGLALCSNFLFDGPYANDLSFQLDSIREMCRVAREVRIYPLLDAQGQISPHLGPIMAQLQLEDYGVEVRQVPYQFFKNGNAMLRVFARNCVVR